MPQSWEVRREGEGYFRLTYEKARQAVPDAGSEFDEVLDDELETNTSSSSKGKNGEAEFEEEASAPGGEY